jgi:hypothetical protein
MISIETYDEFCPGNERYVGQHLVPTCLNTGDDLAIDTVEVRRRWRK